jgi:hypothetical protein
MFSEQPSHATASLSRRTVWRLEAFELRMVEVERLVLAGVPMSNTECFRLGPGFGAQHASNQAFGSGQRQSPQSEDHFRDDTVRSATRRKYLSFRLRVCDFVEN